ASTHSALPLAAPLQYLFHHASLPGVSPVPLLISFFVKHPVPPEIYALSLHDALPICGIPDQDRVGLGERDERGHRGRARSARRRSEEHTSELQSLTNLVCRLLLEKKKPRLSRALEPGPPSPCPPPLASPRSASGAEPR